MQEQCRRNPKENQNVKAILICLKFDDDSALKTEDRGSMILPSLNPRWF
jgi:hypothetical protein